MQKQYNLQQMLDLCKVSSVDNQNKLKNCTTEILAAFALSKNEQDLIEKIKSIITKYSYISIGTALDSLHSISTIGNELDFDITGLDALAYHLSEDICNKAIKALNEVKKHFEKDTLYITKRKMEK